MAYRIRIIKATPDGGVVRHWNRAKQAWQDETGGPVYDTFRGAYRIMNRLWLVAATQTGDRIEAYWV
jgi:hypothetical protein